MKKNKKLNENFRNSDNALTKYLKSASMLKFLSKISYKLFVFQLLILKFRIKIKRISTHHLIIVLISISIFILIDTLKI